MEETIVTLTTSLTEQYETTSLLVGVFVGYIFGFVSSLYLSKRNVTLEKRVSVLLFGVWIIMHIIAFFEGQNISFLFDFLGFGATGNLIGLDASDLISKAFGRKNNGK